MNRRPILLIVVNIAALLLVGGFSLSTQQPVLAATLSDFTQIQWTKLPDTALHPRGGGVSEGQAVTVGNKLYVFGGYSPGNDVPNGFTPTRQVFVFDPATERWTRLANMMKGLTHGGFTTDGTNIYYAGGYVESQDANGNPIGQSFGTREAWSYNIATNTHASLPLLPRRNSTGQLTYLNGKLHYIGGTTRQGNDSGVDLPDHYVFDLEAYKTDPNTQWVDITAHAPLPNPRQHAAIVTLNGMIYYIGGQKGHDGSLEPQNDVHRYNPNVGQYGVWEQMTDIPDDLGRNHMGNSTTVLGGRIIVMAGQTNGYEDKTGLNRFRREEVFAYDPASNTWTQLTSLPMKQHSGVGAALNGVLYFGLGTSNNGGNDRRAVYKGVPVLIDATSTPVPDNATSTPEPTSTTISPEETPNPTATSDGGTGGATQTPDSTPNGGATTTPDSTPNGGATATTAPPTENPVMGTELVVNGGFEVDAEGDKLPDSWKVKGLTRDKMVCNKLNRPGKPDKVVAHEGNCAFQFRGSASENARILQNIAGGSFVANDTLTLSAFVDAKAGVSGRIQATIRYGDSTPTTKIRIDLTPTSGYGLLTKSDVLASGNVSKIKVQIKHTSKTGKIRMDKVSLLMTDTTPGLMPLP